MDASKCCSQCGHSGIFFEIGRSLLEDATGKKRVLCAACVEDETSLSSDEDVSTESGSASPSWTAWAVASVLGPRDVWPGNVADEEGGSTDLESRSSDDDADEHQAKRLRTQ
eukprot:TRINITY_DN110_c0_g1_i1.p1 TRINITY_DN110_c0_g1~~TRINITY_DN110_c0_g1_i1.p1  ORF type:complete len:112 (-),score=20.31 TRINITY_DN110_c0_g1_i1:116-451(-)